MVIGRIYYNARDGEKLFSIESYVSSVEKKVERTEKLKERMRNDEDVEVHPS
jgi:hypothetical protein